MIACSRLSSADPGELLQPRGAGGGVLARRRRGGARRRERGVGCRAGLARRRRHAGRAGERGLRRAAARRELAVDARHVFRRESEIMAGGVELPPGQRAFRLGGGGFLPRGAGAHLQQVLRRDVDAGAHGRELALPLEPRLVGRAAGAVGGLRGEARGRLARLHLRADVLEKAGQQRRARLGVRHLPVGRLQPVAQSVDHQHRVRRRRGEAGPVPRGALGLRPQRPRRIAPRERVLLLLVHRRELPRERQALAELDRRRIRRRAERLVGRVFDRLQLVPRRGELPGDRLDGADLGRAGRRGRRRILRLRRLRHDRNLRPRRRRARREGEGDDNREAGATDHRFNGNRSRARMERRRDCRGRRRRAGA